MVIAPKLEIRQKTSLTLTPFLQQAIKILQMNQAELQSTVHAQLLINPLLESETADEQDQNEPDLPVAETAGDTEAVDALSAAQHEGIKDNALDANYDNVYEGDLVWQQSGRRRNDYSESTSSFEDMVSNPPSLHTELNQQISWLFKAPQEIAIAHGLARHLDENGWLDAEYITLKDEFGCSSEVIDRVVLILHKVEPSGLFARNLQECLTIQLRDSDEWSESLAKMLNKLEWVSQARWKELQTFCGCDAHTLNRHLSAIRRCNPRPASGYETLIVDVIKPDVEVRRLISGSWQIELVHGSLPPVVLNEDFYRNLQQSATIKQDKQYVYQKWQEANWLIKAIAQRNSTLLKVSAAIVKRQEEFFTQGIMSLRPMILRDIAEDVEMHESTISRITSGKYMLTPRGTFELKFFFTATLNGTAGGHLSAESVRHMVKIIIDQEDPGAVLSDDSIAKTLRKEGVEIARRTVAKYRETLKIPGSSIRRRSGRSKTPLDRPESKQPRYLR